jgi:hypothetical protein
MVWYKGNDGEGRHIGVSQYVIQNYARVFMMSSRSALVLGLAVLLLAACGDVREDLGLGRNAPDEFAVVERPPLSMPPDYGLRPPRPGAPRPQMVDTSQQASQALFNGNPPTQMSASSSSEAALLAATGATKADPNIRNTVDLESSQKAVASPHLVERVMDWGDDSQTPGATVDANAEAARIKQVQENNQPINQGATPIIEKQQSSWLGL